MLRPVDVERLIDDEHPARKIWRLVEQLDLSRFETEVRAVEGRAGRRPHSPQLLVAVWIYGYSEGVSSAREISRRMAYEPGMEWLTALRPVNHHTLSDFRVAHGAALDELFAQVLGLLTAKRLITLERTAVDGTKIRAQASKKSFAKRGSLERHLAAARRHIAALDQEQVDEQAAARRQAARRRAAHEREQRLEEALAELEKLRQEKKHDTDKESQASRTDPEARFMKVDGGLAPAYNVQLATDAAHGLIVDVEPLQEPQDSEQIEPAAERLRRRFGRYPRQLLADGAYTNHDSVPAIADKGIDYYSTWTGRNEAEAQKRHPDYRFDKFRWDERRGEFVCPQGMRLAHVAAQQPGPGRVRHVWAAEADDCRACAARPLCCPANSLRSQGRSVSLEIPHPAVERFDLKMAQPEAQAIYKQRAPLAEFPNAWIKEKFGLRRFRCRGLEKVRSEALWAALTFNLLRAFRLAPQLVAA